MALLKLAPCFKDHLSNPHPNKIPLRREVIVPVWGVCNHFAESYYEGNRKNTPSEDLEGLDDK